MQKCRTREHQIKTGVASIMAFSMCIQFAAPSLALIPSFGSKKAASASMQLPMNAKLDAGAAPPPTSEQPAALPDLTPVTLDQSDKSDKSATTNSAATAPPSNASDSASSTATAAPAEASATNSAAAAATPAPEAATTGGDNAAQNQTVLKSTVSENKFEPKEPSAQETAALAPKSINETAKDKSEETAEKVLKNARKVKVMPLALIPSADEAVEKLQKDESADKTELTDLWDATLTRSPDIQFVVQKLMPTTDHSKVTGLMTNMIAMAMYAGVGAASMSTNMGMPGMMGMNSGMGMIGSVLSGVNQKQAKKAALTQTEQIMLYNMVRSTADKLVDNFRNYKKNLVSLNKANSDLVDLQNMVRDARSGQDAAKQIEMEYWVRKQERDIDMAADDVRRYRQTLIDMAGGDAVSKLDNQIAAETTPNADIAQQPSTTAPADATPQDAADKVDETVKDGTKIAKAKNSDATADTAPAADSSDKVSDAQANSTKVAKAKSGAAKSNQAKTAQQTSPQSAGKTNPVM